MELRARISRDTKMWILESQTLAAAKERKKTVQIRAIGTKENNIQDIVNRFFVWHRSTRANRRTWQRPGRVRGFDEEWVVW